jgi:hypothetical protein
MPVAGANEIGVPRRVAPPRLWLLHFEADNESRGDRSIAASRHGGVAQALAPLS